MNNKEYGDLVNSENFPEQVSVPLDTPFIDNRGIIQNLWLAQSGSVTYIESNKGAVRANHKHLHDWHATFIIEGLVKYIEHPSTGTKEYLFQKGNIFFTKPDVFHTMEFLENTKMITINNIVKNHENYENSIVRSK